jgi:hypothetical protein
MTMRPRTFLPLLLALFAVTIAFELRARSLESAPQESVDVPSPLVPALPAAASDCDTPEPVKPVSFGTCS